ncbi:MAG TPA: tRNA (adenosine(37)-N6)-threonylcarbamoyltransferase complex ATPase subunit type 1 TsaE [Actinobacteria bacterium]|nr:tRNA (adenosine(37)-N6)-threonylcarbamoyltransferase complex ATPase subunit type 1 TsaE [Actinomycetota bacterium]
MELVCKSQSAENTKEIGGKLASLTDKGDIILLSGELGGGKTTFISGIAQSLNSKQPVSSPSFTLINIYDCRKNKKPVGIVHCDLYRIDEINDISGIGLEDYIYNEDYIVLIEWAGRLKEGILKDFLEIKFEYIIDEKQNSDLEYSEKQHRKITFNSENKYWDRKITLLKTGLKNCI